MMINDVKTYLYQLQQTICDGLTTLDPKLNFQEDCWDHANGGGGRTRSGTGGDIFEKAGVNFSHVFGNSLPPAASAKRPELAGRPFQALGVSLVVHPNNPYVPTSHTNFRFFCTTDDNPIWWFGGGYDLTPYYGFTEDCQHWHQTAKNACDTGGEHIYPHFKSWCDEYFYLPHRNEARGIGGIFFDDLNGEGFEQNFKLVQTLADSYLDAYLPIIEKRKDIAYGEPEKSFQKYRRGRYVEFNLVYDRGTLFGLQSKGRTESILMSLPPEVTWTYDWKPEPGSKEAELYEIYLPVRDWV